MKTSFDQQLVYELKAALDAARAMRVASEAERKKLANIIYASILNTFDVLDVPKPKKKSTRKKKPAAPEEHPMDAHNEGY